MKDLEGKIKELEIRIERLVEVINHNNKIFREYKAESKARINKLELENKHNSSVGVAAFTEAVLRGMKK